MSSPVQPSAPPAPSGLVGAAASHLSAKIQLAVKTWQTRLIDPTKRNRALNFKPTKVSTVTIVDEQPVEVYRHLCIDGRPMRFRPTLPSAAKTDAAPATEPPTPSGEDDEAPQPMELDFAPYDA